MQAIHKLTHPTLSGRGISEKGGVSEWWLARGVVPWQAVSVGGANVIDVRSVVVLTAY